MERRIQQRANAFHQRNAQPHQLRTPMRNAPDHRQQWRQQGSRYLASPPRPPLDPRRAARGRSNGPARYRAALGTTSRSNPNNQISTVQGIARPSAMASSSIHRGRVIRHFLVDFTVGEAKGSNRSLGQITSPGIAYVAATARSDLSLSSKLAVGHDPLRTVDWQRQFHLGGHLMPLRANDANATSSAIAAQSARFGVRRYGRCRPIRYLAADGRLRRRTGPAC